MKGFDKRSDGLASARRGLDQIIPLGLRRKSEMFCIFYVPLDSQTNWKICPWKELNFQKLYLCFSFFPQLPLSDTEAHSSEIFWVGLYIKRRVSWNLNFGQQCCDTFRYRRSAWSSIVIRIRDNFFSPNVQ